MAMPFPESVRSLEQEIRTMYRELPRLIAEGDEGRYALICGDELYSVWDTLGDAMQAGHEKFGLGHFMTQKIRSSDLVNLAPYFDSVTESVSA